MPKELWYWEKRVPAELISAVTHVRNEFQLARLKADRVTQHCCYASLHPKAKPSDDIREYLSGLTILKAYIGPNSTQFFNDLFKRGTPSAILAAFFHCYKAAMDLQVIGAFRHLQQIGLANARLLAEPPIEWAEWQVKSIINDASYQIGGWLKRCCDLESDDPRSHELDPNAGEEDELDWKSWRAPRYALMQPSLGLPYDAARVSEREDEETSRKAVKAFKQYFVIHLEATLRDCVGTAHLEIAKRPPTMPPQATSNNAAPFQGEVSAQEKARNLSSDFTWKELESRFREIQGKITLHESFYALFERWEWHSGAINEDWELRGNNLACQKDFEISAAIAARKLGYAPNDHAQKHWLGLVRDWMQETGLDKDRQNARRYLSSGTEGNTSHEAQSLEIYRPAEISALYCGKLLALGTPESTIQLSSEQSADGSGSSAASGMRSNSDDAHQGSVAITSTGKLQQYRSEIKRAVLIQLTQNPDATDLEICRGLDADGAVEMSGLWQKGSGSRSFEDAYRASKIKPKIEKTFSKVRADLRKLRLLGKR